MIHFGLSGAIITSNRTAVPAIIAEVKTYSPQHGDLLGARSITDILHTYEECGATGISYITAKQFRGSMTDFSSLCEASRLPVLRKDFIDTYSDIEDTAAAGGSAVLLIARTLKEKTAEFVDVALSLGLDTLVEVHSPEEIALAEETATTMMGINNRDIACFETDGGTVAVTERLAPLISKGAILVSESGIASADDLRRALRCADAALIGTSLMQAPSIRSKMREFLEVSS